MKQNAPLVLQAEIDKPRPTAQSAGSLFSAVKLLVQGVRKRGLRLRTQRQIKQHVGAGAEWRRRRRRSPAATGLGTLPGWPRSGASWSTSTVQQPAGRSKAHLALLAGHGTGGQAPEAAGARTQDRSRHIAGLHRSQRAGDPLEGLQRAHGVGVSGWSCRGGRLRCRESQRIIQCTMPGRVGAIARSGSDATSHSA